MAATLMAESTVTDPVLTPPCVWCNQQYPSGTRGHSITIDGEVWSPVCHPCVQGVGKWRAKLSQLAGVNEGLIKSLQDLKSNEYRMEERTRSKQLALQRAGANEDAALIGVIAARAGMGAIADRVSAIIIENRRLKAVALHAARLLDAIDSRDSVTMVEATRLLRGSLAKRDRLE